MKIEEALKYLKKEIICLETDETECLETKTCNECPGYISEAQRLEAIRAVVEYFDAEGSEDNA